MAVATPDDVNENHAPSPHEERVLTVLKDGRGTGPWGFITPSRVAERHDVPRQRVNEAIDRLEAAGWIEQVEVDGAEIRGLYRLVDDPRDEPMPDDESELRARLQDALEARDDQRSKADRLQDGLTECREQLKEYREERNMLREQLEAASETESVDAGVLQEAAAYAETASEHLQEPVDVPGARTAVADALAVLQRAREALDGG